MVLTWEEKLYAMQSVDCNCKVNMIKPGIWTCYVPGEIGGDGLLCSECGKGISPEDAVNQAWNKVLSIPEGKYIQIKDRHLLWNGFMFEDV